jgi:SagB-type dehydrogenase family enzyme
MMDHQSRTTILDYLDSIFQRWETDAQDLRPEESVNWSDQPARFKLYQSRRISLPAPGEIHQTFLNSANACVREQGSLTLSRLSALLYLLGAPMQRKLGIHWGQMVDSLVRHPSQIHARATASGGGLYPVEFYLAVQAGSVLLPGIYHYCGGHHGLVPLAWGDQGALLCDALWDDDSPAPFQMYLLLSLDFWKNCFKYRNFGYHVCTQDIGAALATISLVCEALGIRRKTFLCFDDRKLNRLLELDMVNESIFSVVGIGMGDSVFQDRPGRRVVSGPCCKPEAWQRSKSKLIPDDLRQVHLASLMSAEDWRRISSRHRTTERAGMPQYEHEKAPQQSLQNTILGSLPSVLMARHSSWGAMRAAMPMTLDSLLAMMRYVVSATREVAASGREMLPLSAMRFVIVTSHVRGLPRGAYDWDFENSVPVPRTCDLPAGGWQWAYALDNYNLEQSACLIFVAVNVESMLDHFHQRGYRIMNHFVGVVAQFVYVAAAALDLCCGAVLGIRERMLKTIFRLDNEQEILLLLLVGRGNMEPRAFEYTFLGDVPRWH